MAKRDEQTDELEIQREDEACIQIWKWNKKINPYGPISVETKWKKWALDQWPDITKKNNKEE